MSAQFYRQELVRQNREPRESKQALERLQAQIVHSEKMASLDQLAGGISDLDRLLEFFQTLELAPRDAARYRALKEEVSYDELRADLLSIVGDCRDGARRIRDLVQNLCTFSRLDEAEFKKVDIHEGLESTIRLLSRYFTSGSIRLEREYGNVPPVDCYAGQLNQVWMNLLANAAQSLGRRGGEVRIKTWLEGDRALVRISDDGCGIAPEHLKKIFDPFFTTKPVGEGTGLGLSATYSIIERHGGTIEVMSEPGAGTSFTVNIPVYSKPRLASEQENALLLLD